MADQHTFSRNEKKGTFWLGERKPDDDDKPISHAPHLISATDKDNAIRLPSYPPYQSVHALYATTLFIHVIPNGSMSILASCVIIFKSVHMSGNSQRTRPLGFDERVPWHVPPPLPWAPVNPSVYSVMMLMHTGDTIVLVIVNDTMPSLEVSMRKEGFLRNEQHSLMEESHPPTNTISIPSAVTRHLRFLRYRCAALG